MLVGRLIDPTDKFDPIFESDIETNNVRSLPYLEWTSLTHDIAMRKYLQILPWRRKEVCDALPRVIEAL